MNPGTPSRAAAPAKAMALAALLLASAPWAAPTISSVTTSGASVGKYAKEELSVGLGTNYSNPYDPSVIDLSATFTSPTGKVWKVNGFYDGTGWKVRFAGNETGTWTYTVTAVDATGTTTSPGGTFGVATSAYHGWVRIAPNKRFLAYDDGTSFFGIGACEAWGPSTTTLSAMQGLGYNTWVYWNGTYDGSGGGNLIESMTSGLGKYDPAKGVRIDSLLSWSEQDGLTMILVVWPHDYLCNSAASCPSGWPSQWTQSNPYSTIVSAANFYSDAAAWTHQQNLYRYMIARWGYSRALQGWQTIDEIGGTDGWAASQTDANAWAAKIATYFQGNDPFRHLTNGSQGSYWPQGNTANDVANTEDYSDYTAAGVSTIVKQLWANNTKPAIMGETGLGSPQSTLWGALASGVSITPLLWQFRSSGDNWVTADETAYAPIVAFTKGMDFAHLASPAQASPSVSGATAYGMTSTHVSWGYITGSFAGKSLGLSGLANDTYTLGWWNCTTGAVISSSTVSVTGGTLSSAIPSTTGSDIAYKLVSTTSTSIPDRATPAPDLRDVSVAYDHGLLRLSSPVAESVELEVVDLGGRTVARARIPASTGVAAVGRLGDGVRFARFHSETRSFVRPIVVEN